MEPRRDVFQAIADPTRREILAIISQKSKNVSEIAGQFEMSRQAVSLHVKILQECGILTVMKEGRERQCSLQPEKMKEVADWIEPFRKMWETRFDQLDSILHKMNQNPKTKIK